MDFGPADGAIWPMRLTDGGGLYGFCPAKATWDAEATGLYNLMVTAYETKSLLYKGGLADQPGWFVELLSWFVVRYDENKFYSRASSILGSTSRGGSNGNNNGRIKGRSKGR